MQANKDSNYQIKDKEKDFYHVRLYEEVPTADDRSVIPSEKVQVFSVQGFKQFIANKRHFTFKKEEILHDPTLIVAESVATTEQTSADPPKAKEPAIGEKKVPYFATQEFKDKMAEKKKSNQ